MLLHDSARAPNPRRVRIFAAEKGIELPTRQYDIVKGENLTPEFMAKNPFGLLPVLELDDGTCIGETMAICRYLEATHPEPRLFGRTPIEQARVEEWSRHAELDGFGSVTEAFRNGFPGFANRGQGGSTEPIPQIPALVERGKAGFHRFLKRIDARLADHRFLAGDAFSVADINALCAIDFARVIKESIPEGLANARRWHAEVSARPSAKA